MASRRIYDEITPTFKLLREEESDTIVLELSGFVKEQVKAQIDRHRKLRITGERPLTEIKNRWVRFHKEFQVADDCDVSKIQAKFNNGQLYVILPKLKARASQKAETAKDPKSQTTTTEKIPSPKPYQEPDVISREQNDEKIGKAMDERKENPKAEEKGNDLVKESMKVTAEQEDGDNKDHDNKVQQMINDRKNDLGTATHMTSNQVGSILGNQKLNMGTLGSGMEWNRQLKLNVIVGIMVFTGLGLYAIFKLKNLTKAHIYTTDSNISMN